MWKIAGGIFFGVLLLFLAMTLFADQFSAADINAQCINNKGVKEIKDNTWSGFTGEQYFIICNDGTVKGLD